MFVTIVAPAPCAPSDPDIEHRARLDPRKGIVLLQVKYPGKPQFTTEARCTVEELDRRLEHNGRSRATATHEDLRRIAMTVRIQDRLREHSYLYGPRFVPPAR
jgi:hypothetical protein